MSNMFGANLVALNKKGGVVHPIAMGCTLQRLVSKCAGLLIRDEMGELLAPRQLGYGVKRESEAAVHAVCRFVCCLKCNEVFSSLSLPMPSILYIGTRC